MIEKIVGAFKWVFLVVWLGLFVNSLSESTSIVAMASNIFWPLAPLQKWVLHVNNDVLSVTFLLVAATWVWAFPIIHLMNLVKWFFWGRKVNQLPGIMAKEQLEVVMQQIKMATQPIPTQFSDSARHSVVSLLKQFEKGVRELFGLASLKDTEHAMFWFVDSGDPRQPKIWSKKGNPVPEEQKLIDWAFRDAWATCRDDVQKARLYNGREVEAIITARNIDDFRVGFVLLVYKKVRIPKHKVAEFQMSAASLLMLGQMDNIREAMLQLTKEDWKVVGNP